MTPLMTPLTGLYIPLITPFTADGHLAPAALERLAHRVLDDGATGIVALGTTAETATLTQAERAQVLDICDRVCAERAAPLIAGAGTNDTARSAAALAGLARYQQVRAALTVVPYYSRPGEAGVLEHYRALAASSPVPLIMYNIPYRTGQAVSWRTMRQLAELPGIAGVKHAAGSIDQDTVAMMAGRPARFSVLGGDDLYVSPLPPSAPTAPSWPRPMCGPASSPGWSGCGARALPARPGCSATGSPGSRRRCSPSRTRS
jgi:4-hydroxy-tetrahydrodipicolinate synthase